MSTYHYEYSLQTQKQHFHNITSFAEEALQKSGAENGICLVFCPHTTAAVTLNENADKDVVGDLCFALDQTFPDRKEFRHSEGNSAAHFKSSCIGPSLTLPFIGGKLKLGVWQAVYFCEFDGPRKRSVFVTIVT